MSLFKNGSCVFTVHEAENGFIAEITQAGRPILVIGKTLSECCDAAQAAAASIQVRQAKRKPVREMDDDEEVTEEEDEEVASMDKFLKAWDDAPVAPKKSPKTR